MGIGRWQNEWVYELCESLCFSSDTLFFFYSSVLFASRVSDLHATFLSLFLFPFSLI